MKRTRMGMLLGIGAGMIWGSLFFSSSCDQTLGGEDMATDLTTAPAEDLTPVTLLKGSCDLRKGAPAQQECRDYESASSSVINTYKGICTSGWADAACNRTGAVGGCRYNLPQAGGGTLTRWYFPQSGISTPADVQAKCAMDGGTYVSP
jgi:hypothetical protein